MVAEGTDARDFAFVDECGTHTSMAPVYGYSPRGEQRAHLEVPRSRGPNTRALWVPSLGSASMKRAVDELGFVPFERARENFLFDLLRGRHEACSTIITTTPSFGEWMQAFGDEKLTGALLNRLGHHAHVLTSRSNSCRTRSDFSAVDPHRMMRTQTGPPKGLLGRSSRTLKESPYDQGSLIPLANEKDPGG